MITFKKYVQVIEEGGAYGHMANMYEDTDLAFGQLKELTKGLFDQSIKADFKEKTDGQALAVTVKPDETGELKTFYGRNPGHIKNGSATALTLDEIQSKFEGRGDLSDAFIFAASDISRALESLSPDVLGNVFLNGRDPKEWGYRWLHIEIIWPETTNVIPYGLRKLIIHNYTEHDPSGQAIGSDFNQTAEYLVDELRTIKQSSQQNFEIDFMPLLNLPKIRQSNEKAGQYVDYFNKLQQQWKLSDSNTIGDLYEEIYKAHILNNANDLGYADITEDLLNQLVNRWVYEIREPNIGQIKKSIPNNEFKQWVGDHEREHKKWSELNVRNVIKIPFIRIAIDILSGMVDLWIAIDTEHAAILYVLHVMKEY